MECSEERRASPRVSYVFKYNERAQFFY